MPLLAWPYNTTSVLWVYALSVWISGADAIGFIIAVEADVVVVIAVCGWGLITVISLSWKILTYTIVLPVEWSAALNIFSSIFLV